MCPVHRVVRADANGEPGLRQRFGVLVGYGLKKSFEEQVVDVDADVVVVEGQIRRAGKLEAVGRLMLMDVLRLCRPVKKDGPAFLEKGEKSLAIRDDRFEGPGVKTILLAENLYKAFIDQRRDALFPVMTAQQHAQQIEWFSDEFRGNLEHMPQNEFLGRVIAQDIRSMALLGFVQRVQVSVLQGGHNGVAQVGKNLRKAE